MAARELLPLLCLLCYLIRTLFCTKHTFLCILDMNIISLLILWDAFGDSTTYVKIINIMLGIISDWRVESNSAAPAGRFRGNGMGSFMLQPLWDGIHIAV